MKSLSAYDVGHRRGWWEGLASGLVLGVLFSAGVLKIALWWTKI